MVKLSRVRAGDGEGTFDNAFRKLKEKQSTMNMLTDKLKKMKVDGHLLPSDVDVVVVDAKIEEEDDIPGVADIGNEMVPAVFFEAGARHCTDCTLPEF